MGETPPLSSYKIRLLKYYTELVIYRIHYHAIHEEFNRSSNIFIHLHLRPLSLYNLHICSHLDQVIQQYSILHTHHGQFILPLLNQTCHFIAVNLDCSSSFPIVMRIA